MVRVSGTLVDFVEDPSIVAQVQVRAREVRPHGDGVMLDHPVNVDWDPPTGTVTFDAAAGTAGVVMWHAVGRSHASGSLPIVVPDGDTATLRECVEAVMLADEGTLNALERLALEVAGMVATVGNITQLETWADSAKQDATTATAAAGTAQGIADSLPVTIQSELDTRVPPLVPPLVADALAGDRAVADAAAAAVSTAATGAGLEPQRTFEVDQSGRAEWSQITETGERLPLGYTADGRLDDLARQVWREDVTHTYDSPLDDYAYAVATEQGHLLLGVRKDGTITAPGMTGQTAAPAQNDLYVHRDGTVRKATADMTRITTWGSSTPDLMTDALAQAFADTPATVTKQAKGGEWIEHHAARIGAVPALIDPVTIPESGDVAVTIGNFPDSMDYNYAMLSYTGTLAGIYGTLSASREQFTFTRATAGSAVTLTEPTEFLPDVGPETRDHVIILGPGKNNLTQSTTGEADVIAYTDKIFDWLTPQAPRCIVLAHHNNTGWSAGSVTKGRIRRVNEHYRRRFGPLFFDLLGLITSDEIWDRTGITPTPEDLTEQALGNLAPSLGRDTLHLNETANLAVAQAIRDHVDDLGWY